MRKKMSRRRPLKRRPFTPVANRRDNGMLGRYFGASKQTVSYFSLLLSHNVWKPDTCDFHANTINLCKMCTGLTDIYLYDCVLSSQLVELQRLKGLEKCCHSTILHTVLTTPSTSISMPNMPPRTNKDTRMSRMKNNLILVSAQC